MYFFIYTKLGVFIWRLRHWKGGGTVCILHGEEKTQTNSERMTEDCHTRLKTQLALFIWHRAIELLL